MNSISLKSYAKINIFLHIFGKRADGYHELNTLFTKIGIYDTLTVSKSAGMKITCTNKNIPTDHRNIISRVHAVLEQGYGIRQQFQVHIEKHIPDGGGLGGGSSNAACYLEAVLNLMEIDMSMADKTDIMASVGSDTAFFLHNEPMTGEGRGEILTPYGEIPKAYAVLINPCVHISTGQVFSSGKITLTDRAEVNKIRHAYTFSDYGSILFNGLESAVLGIYPSVAHAKNSLLESGADFALMSGSGATVFGLVEDALRAEQVYENMRRKHPEWKCFLTKLIQAQDVPRTA